MKCHNTMLLRFTKAHKPFTKKDIDCQNFFKKTLPDFEKIIEAPFRIQHTGITIKTRPNIQVTADKKCSI